MNFTNKHRQTAVYWGPPESDGYGGHVWSAPSALSCRWEDKAIRFVSATGEEATSRSVVQFSSKVEPGGMLLLGDLDSSVDQDDPLANTGVFPIRQVNSCETLDGTVSVWEAML